MSWKLFAPLFLSLFNGQEAAEKPAADWHQELVKAHREAVAWHVKGNINTFVTIDYEGGARTAETPSTLEFAVHKDGVGKLLRVVRETDRYEYIGDGDVFHRVDAEETHRVYAGGLVHSAISTEFAKLFGNAQAELFKPKSIEYFLGSSAAAAAATFVVHYSMEPSQMTSGEPITDPELKEKYTIDIYERYWLDAAGTPIRIESEKVQKFGGPGGEPMKVLDVFTFDRYQLKTKADVADYEKLGGE